MAYAFHYFSGIPLKTSVFLLILPCRSLTVCSSFFMFEVALSILSSPFSILIPHNSFSVLSCLPSTKRVHFSTWSNLDLTSLISFVIEACILTMELSTLLILDNSWSSSCERTCKVGSITVICLMGSFVIILISPSFAAVANSSALDLGNKYLIFFCLSNSCLFSRFFYT